MPVFMPNGYVPVFVLSEKPKAKDVDEFLDLLAYEAQTHVAGLDDPAGPFRLVTTKDTTHLGEQQTSSTIKALKAELAANEFAGYGIPDLEQFMLSKIRASESPDAREQFIPAGFGRIFFAMDDEDLRQQTSTVFGQARGAEGEDRFVKVRAPWRSLWSLWSSVAGGNMSFDAFSKESEEQTFKPTEDGWYTWCSWRNQRRGSACSL